jgi:hypothetical protein
MPHVRHNEGRVALKIRHQILYTHFFPIRKLGVADQRLIRRDALSVTVITRQYVRKETQTNTYALDELRESTVDGRAERLDVLVEVNGCFGALGNALGCEFEFLQTWSITDCQII